MVVRCVGDGELRAVSLRAIGLLCRSLGGREQLSSRVDELLQLVKQALQPTARGVTGRKQGQRGSEVPSAALCCVADMACGLGEPFHAQVTKRVAAVLCSPHWLSFKY